MTYKFCRRSNQSYDYDHKHNNGYWPNPPFVLGSPNWERFLVARQSFDVTLSFQSQVVVEGMTVEVYSTHDVSRERVRR